jgi:SNF2 family DNA or RNA helicase
MTGTPFLNNQMDLWSQFYILDLGETLGDSFFAYRARYFWDLNAGKRGTRAYFPLFVPKKTSSNELARLIESKSVVAKKEDCLDLPPLVKKQVEVSLAPDQRAAYEEMKKDFLTYVNDKACVAVLAITKALRMQQILSGFIKLEDGSIHRFKDNPRAKALKELLEEICVESGEKCIVWSVFHEDYAVVRKACEDLKIEYREIHGLVSGPSKLTAMEDFELKPEVKVIICSPGAGGIGISLIAASYSIWYSRNFNLEHDQQAEARNHRGGSERHEKITRIDLVVPGSLDSVVLDSLSQKKSIAESILTLPQML